LPTIAPGAEPATAAPTDARVLPVLRNTSGERFRTLQSAADAMVQEHFDDFALEGPRTFRWWVQQVFRLGTGAVARHHTWRHENSVNEDSHLNQLHEVLSEVVEMALCVDQVDGVNLVSMEVAARHLQYVEHEVRKKTEAKKGDSSGAEYFLGKQSRAGGALIAPELLKWVAERAARDSAVMKEHRKAMEERALARAPKK